MAGLSIFLDYYRDHIADRTRPFPGTRPALKKLQRAGAVMAVCTNKPQDLSEKVLAALKLDHFFKAVVGADAAPNRKPHADHVMATLQAMGGMAEEAIFVGDSATDVNAARNADIPVIAVSFGYSTVKAADLGADALIDSMAPLPATIDSFWEDA